MKIKLDLHPWKNIGTSGGTLSEGRIEDELHNLRAGEIICILKRWSGQKMERCYEKK